MPVQSCLLCPDRDTGAALYQGDAVIRIRTGRNKPPSVEETRAIIIQCLKDNDCAPASTLPSQQHVTAPANTAGRTIGTHDFATCSCYVRCLCRGKCYSPTADSTKTPVSFSSSFCLQRCITDTISHACVTGPLLAPPVDE